MTGDFFVQVQQEGWEIGCLCIMQTIIMTMISPNEVTVSVMHRFGGQGYSQGGFSCTLDEGSIYHGK